MLKLLPNPPDSVPISSARSAALHELLSATCDYLHQKKHVEGVLDTPIADLHLLRFPGATAPTPLLYKPRLCVPVQGTKHAVFGDQSLVYEPLQALVVALDMPVSSRAVSASAERPFLGLTLDLDMQIVREVALQIGTLPAAESRECGFFVIDVSVQLSQCLTRMVSLLQIPRAIPVLYKPLMQEISF
jgi:AraC-type transcriptional regulator N-terminus